MADNLTLRLQHSLRETFTIERELGGGGMARVFLAREDKIERRVVVKVLDLEQSVAASAERFRREVQLIATLQHPHIVPLLTAGGDDSLLWYAMPYVSGESLRARLLREGALPLADAIRIAREVFDALDFAHARGVVHRDVKPENILLEGRHALVADFGVAKALADAGISSGLTSAGMALGTPAYMAPEQAMADPTTNHRADLYAAGAVLYEMLAGAPPFSGTAQSVVAAHIAAPAPRIEERRQDIPAALAHLMNRLLAKNPAERPQSAEEALTILETVATPTGLSAAAAPAAPGRASRRGSGWRRPAALVTPLVAIGLIGAVWMKTRSPASRIASGTDVIAVMPVGSTGDSTLTRLGRDLVVTLSTSLDGVGQIRAVDAMTVLQGAKTLPQPLRLTDALDLGKRFGAKTIVQGVVTAEAGQAHIEISLYPVAGGDPIATAAARGSTDSIRALTDTLTKQLLEQIWRRGKPPSPLLSQVATSSGPALRAFLAGEAEFERLQLDSAIANYARATELDSAFAQAWLRLDYARSMALLPMDTAIRRHLLAVRNRLPRREQDWLRVRLGGLPFLQSLDSARAIAARYPESYAIQYLVMDDIVHAGPRYGISIDQALPYLERLRALSPENVDVSLHRFMVAWGMADTSALVMAQRERTGHGVGPGQKSQVALLRIFETIAAGREPSFHEFAQVGANDWLLKMNPDAAWYPDFIYSVPLTTREAQDSLAAAVAATQFAAANPQLMAFNRATLAISRGSMKQGLTELAAFAGQRIPGAVRISSAWSTADAAWLGLISSAEADSILAKIRPQLADLPAASRIDVQWADGVAAIVAEDSSRLATTMAAVIDTTATGRSLVRELRALWRQRRTGSIDSLRAFEEGAIRSGVVSLAGLPIRRAALGRALMREGDAAGAERLLQWPDATANNIRLELVTYLFGRYMSYERGLAAEAVGDRKSAIRHYNDFLAMIDQPPPSMASSVADARARLARLTTDARRTP